MNRRLFGVLYVSLLVIIWGTLGSFIDFPLLAAGLYLPGSLGQALTFVLTGFAFAGIGFSFYSKVTNINFISSLLKGSKDQSYRQNWRNRSWFNPTHLFLLEDICGINTLYEGRVVLTSLLESMSSLKPYTVRYRSFDNVKIENCFYASDSYEARLLAMEFNKYIYDHPNCIDLIRCEAQH